jgi:hypothetical protein
MGVVERSVREALETAPLALTPDRGPYRVVLESPGGEGDVRYDVPLSFAPIERRYGTRYVTTEWVAGPAAEAIA